MNWLNLRILTPHHVNQKYMYYIDKHTNLKHTVYRIYLCMKGLKNIRVMFNKEKKMEHSKYSIILKIKQKNQDNK